MKKKIFGGIALLAITAVMAFNVSLNLNNSNNPTSLLALANVEALAQVESGDYCDLYCYVGHISRCWKKHYGLSMVYSCVRTGNTTDYCEPFNYYL